VYSQFNWNWILQARCRVNWNSAHQSNWNIIRWKMKSRICSSWSLKASWVRLPLPKKSLPLLLLLRTIPIRLACACPIAIPVNSIHANVFYGRYRSSYRITETADTNVCVWKLVRSAKHNSVRRLMQSRNLPSVESNSLHSRNPQAFNYWVCLHIKENHIYIVWMCKPNAVAFVIWGWSTAAQRRTEQNRTEQNSTAQHSTAHIS